MNRLETFWRECAYHNRGALRLLSPLLIPLSGLYSAIASSRRQRIQGITFPCPILSIGNLTVGGVGKTPFTIYLSHFLQNRGYKPAVLIRGYGRKSNESILLTPDRFDPVRIEEYGDEAALILLRTGAPVAIGRDRVASAERVINETESDILLLDDGFQHLPIHRDVDLVLMDAKNPIGNGYTLPYGPLREPVAAMQHAHALIFHGEKISSDWIPDTLPVFNGTLEWEGILSLQDWMETHQEAGVSIPDFKSKEIRLLSGIGNPDRLENQAREYGFTIRKHHRFPDHHWFCDEDIKTILAESSAWPIFLTEKDAIRFMPLREIPSRNYSAFYVIQAGWRQRENHVFETWLISQLQTLTQPD